MTAILTMAWLAGCDQRPVSTDTLDTADISIKNPVPFQSITTTASSETVSGRTAIERSFELAKSSRPQLIAFLRAMPKGADLHNHLWGTGYSELIFEDAVASGYNYNTATRMFTTVAAGGDVLTLDRVKDDIRLFREFREAYSARGFVENGGSGRDAFFSVFERLPTAAYSEIDMLGDTITRAAAQNISYLELQTRVVPAAVHAQFDVALANFDPQDLSAAYAQVKPLLADPDIHATISNNINTIEAVANYRQSDGTGLSPEDIRVNYLTFLLRHGRLRDYFLSVATGMTAIQADPRVVGMNIVAPEDHPDSQTLFEDHMRIIDFMWQRMGEPNMTLHAGELTLKDSNPDEMRDRIRKTIDIGHAKRIGHGVSIAWEDDVYGLLNQMAEDKILVEICLTSNEVILGVAYNEHPFDLYRQYGVPLSLNTDDEGINRSVLTLEFVQAVERYNLSYADVLELARNSLEYSFASGSSLFVDHDYNTRRPEFSNSIIGSGNLSDAQKRLATGNQKLALQIDFERRLAAFESQMIGN